MVTRFTKLPKHDNVLVGRDIAELFENGHVYEVRKILGEYIIRDLGLTALPEGNPHILPNAQSSIEQIMTAPGATYLLTKEEAGRLL